MKKVIFFVLLFCFAIASIAQTSRLITVTGTVTGDTKGMNTIYYYRGGAPVDSVMIENEKFVIKLPFTEMYTQLFYTRYDLGPAKNKGYSPYALLIDGTGDIMLDFAIEEGFVNAKVNGPETTVLFASFLKNQKATYRKMNEELVRMYGKGWVPPKDPMAQNMAVSRDSLTKIFMGDLVRNFVTKNKNTFVGVYVLAMSGRSVLNIDEMESLLKSVPLQLQKIPEAEKLAAYIRGTKSAKVGDMVKNFILNDPQGKPVSFQQYKGKYVWIDFWASWCAPCKQAFPHMRELYAKYKDKNFEILGVSTDATIDPWLKILPVINNPWPQVWDNKNLFSEFAVDAFPTSFLISPDGKILLKEVGYNPAEKSGIEKKLEELFGPKID